jgi:hypothetical protein
MMHGVIADLMPVTMNAAHEVRILIGPLTCDEEGGLDVVPGQDIQDARSWSRRTTRIEGQGNKGLTGIAHINF